MSHGRWHSAAMRGHTVACAAPTRGGAQPPAPSRTRFSSLRGRDGTGRSPETRVLDPERLPDFVDQLYRAAWALCGSQHDAEDLVQETFVNVLKRPRLLRKDNEIGYLLQALRNTYVSRYRSSAHRREERELTERDLPPARDEGPDAREIMEAIAGVSMPYRDAVIAVDLIGLSYREAARWLRTPEATLTTRLHRGRQQVARALVSDDA
jgi:RNA polymerase sigma-70 factor (ECF subfamily)